MSLPRHLFFFTVSTGERFTGGIAAGGQAVVTASYTATISGGPVGGGAALAEVVLVMRGGVAAGGAATVAQTFVFAASGGAVTGGSAAAAVQYVVTMASGAASGG